MIRKRIRSYKVGQRGDIKRWHNCLTGVPAFLIGNGPSLDNLDLSCLKNHFTIGINRAFLKIDPTILMWQDSELWWNHRTEISRLKAVKFCRDISDPKGRFYHFKLTTGNFELPETPSILFGRGATGPVAFQLAYILGCNPIILLGMDCCYYNGKTNFYGKNPSHKPHTLVNCKKGLTWMKKCPSGRKIINCSNNNVFEERRDLNDVVKEIPFDRPHNRDSFLARLHVETE